jgi:hypothetical protein
VKRNIILENFWLTGLGHQIILWSERKGKGFDEQKGKWAKGLAANENMGPEENGMKKTKGGEEAFGRNGGMGDIWPGGHI